jgi:hypothetical protein
MASRAAANADRILALWLQIEERIKGCDTVDGRPLLLVIGGIDFFLSRPPQVVQSLKP